MQINEYDLEKRYDDFLTEVFGDVKICGHAYDSANALKEIDPTAYRCSFADWLDSEVSDERLFIHADGEYYDEPENEE